MKHKKMKILVSSYLDNELKSSEKDIVVKHLKTCAECKEFVEKAAHIHKAIHSMEKIKLHTQFPNRMIGLIDEEIKNAEKWITVERMARNAFAAIAIGMIALFLLINLKTSDQKQTSDSIILAPIYISSESKSDSVIVQMMLSENGISNDDIMYAVMTK